MSFIKSLVHNLEDGVDVPRHRTHRSKKGKNLYNKENSPTFLKYKRKKRELYENKFTFNLHNYK